MMKMKRLIFMLILYLCCMTTVMLANAAGDQRVFDEAELLNSEEIKIFEEQIAKLRQAMNMDVVVVTIEDAVGKSAQDYADDYYDDNGFGRGNENSGVLLLIDMDNRELWISTTGDMIRFLTDKRIDNILDRVYEGVVNQNYSYAVEQFLYGVETYYQKGIPSSQYTYDSETGEISRHLSLTGAEIMISVVVALLVAGIPCMVIKKNYSMDRVVKQSNGFNLSYREQCDFACRSQNDHYINKFVTRRIIPQSSSSSGNRSTTHRSRSGTSHGGGGRKF